MFGFVDVGWMQNVRYTGGGPKITERSKCVAGSGEDVEGFEGKENIED